MKQSIFSTKLGIRKQPERPFGTSVLQNCSQVTYKVSLRAGAAPLTKISEEERNHHHLHAVYSLTEKQLNL